MLRAPTSLSVTLVPVALVSLVALACSDSGATPAPSSTSSATPTASNTVATAAVMPPACDQYAEKMKACIEKAPAEERAKRTEALEKTRAAWADESRDPKTSPNLASACQAALTAVEQDASCK
ncbi:MAG TPA: hypothetical protein VL400_16735 [Polyangiaceae bacterium]|jgi:hypothetical protein|nr:hypothetical protein [Polyangiaceae bacterium]